MRTGKSETGLSELQRFLAVFVSYTKVVLGGMLLATLIFLVYAGISTEPRQIVAIILTSLIVATAWHFLFPRFPRIANNTLLFTDAKRESYLHQYDVFISESQERLAERVKELVVDFSPDEGSVRKIALTCFWPSGSISIFDPDNLKFENSVEQEYFKKEQVKLFNDAFGKLKTTRKEAVGLKILGYSAAEIATEMKLKNEVYARQLVRRGTSDICVYVSKKLKEGNKPPRPRYRRRLPK